jgi:hypothetical protein
MTAMHARERMAARQIAVHLLIQPVVTQEPVKLNQHRVCLVGQFGDSSKDIFGRIAIDEHAGAPLLIASAVYMYPLAQSAPQAPPGLKPSILQRQLVLGRFSGTLIAY